MSMSLALAAMPSSSSRAASLTSEYTSRCTISSSLIRRGVMPSAARWSAIICSTTGLGMASRLPAW